MKDYRRIKLKNGIANAIEQAIADVAVAGLENRIQAYKTGMITADEMIQYIEYVSNANKEVQE